MNKIAFMFSGQGSEYRDMGRDLYDSYDIVREIFIKAESITQYPIRDIIFNDDNRLHQTKYTQVCMFTMYHAILKLLKEYHVEAIYSFGLSLGEYGAYLHNQVFDFEQGLNIVKNRAIFMEEASINTKGKMAAVLNLDPIILQNLIDDSGKEVTIANYNTPSQLVISGESQAVDEISVLAKEHGAKRIIELNTSGAFHSPLMNKAAKNFSDYLKTINLNNPIYHLYVNLTGKLFDGNIKDVMAKQINHSVKFYQIVNELVNQGIDTFIEIGPKRTLSSFVKKINNQMTTLSVENKESLNTLVKTLEERHGK